jgi:hypothetical protein
MRFPTLTLTAALLAGCGGHAAAPASTTPEPAARAAQPAGDPAMLRYAPANGRYRYEQTQHTSQEMMGQTQEVNVSSTLVVSTTVSAGDAGSLNTAITVDSATMSNSAVPGNPMEGLRGKTFRGVISPNGRSTSFTAPDTLMTTALSGEIFRDFLPTLPASTAPGTTWTDTVIAPPVNAQGLRVTSTSIRNHRVVGWETKDGVRALHIATNGTYTLAGQGEQNGATLQLAGTGTATADRYVSAAGVYLGTTVSDSTNATVTVSSMGLEIPVHQSRHTTVTRLP